MWHAADGFGWWMIWGGLMMVLFWGGVIALAVWTVKSLAGGETGAGQPPRPGTPPASALDIARERYARGEISRDEFQQISKDLEGS